MIYIVDKATNRVLHHSEAEGQFFVDELSYSVTAEPFHFERPLNTYKWNATTLIFDDAAPDKPVSTYDPPPGHRGEGHRTPTVTEGILNRESWGQFQQTLRHKDTP